ncbi:MAG: galactokinase family protein [Candidatus Latescibacterota bacterium]
MHSAPLGRWLAALEGGALDGLLTHLYGPEAAAWRRHYREALHRFAESFGAGGEVVIARCPGQMNAMGVHIDYGGMPSIRLAVRGRDTLTVARANPDGRVRLRNVLRYPGEPEEKFPPIEFDLGDVLPAENVGTREALMAYAARVCNERQRRTGSLQVSDWSVLVEGQLVYLESRLRGRVPFHGFDGLVWSNVSPSGGMSSSSALVISTACAALGVHGLDPRQDLELVDLVDGVGTSEWIRGTRGGTADHGGMVMGRAGRLVSVGVFPARPQGEAVLPEDYVAFVMDSGVPRVYDDAVKEETVIAYPLGTFAVRDLLLPRLAADPDFSGLVPDWRQRTVFIRDITLDNLGLSLPALYRLLRGVPARTTLGELEAWARREGAGEAWQEVQRREVAGKFPHITPEYPVLLRRRCVYGLAEQDRVRYLLEYINAGDMPTALELIRVSHDGDLDQEVEDAVLADREARARRGEERARLCFLPGGYGRMTPAYDRVVRLINAFLLERGGASAGSVQRFGAGWGGNIGGLVRRQFVEGERQDELRRLLREELGLEVDPAACVATPGEGAGLLEAPPRV